MGKIQFHDYNVAYSDWDLPNVNIFREQIAVFKEMLAAAPPDESQSRDTDFLLTVGEMFTLVAYGQLILENARIYDIAGRHRGPDLRLHGAGLLEVRAAALQQAEVQPGAVGLLSEDDTEAGGG